MSCTCASVAYQYENVFIQQQRRTHLSGVIYLQIGRVYFFSRRVPKFPTIWDLGVHKVLYWLIYSSLPLASFFMEGRERLG
jgi:hypothetical protein